MPGRRLPSAISWLIALGALLIVTPIATPANAVPTAPKPTSTAVSPDAPDPHPPAGGQGPDGTVPGGSRLASRGTVTPTGAPPLPKQIQARAWLLADLDSGDILAARDAHGRYQPASTLKLLTALTVLPHLPGSKVVTVSAQAANAEGSAVGLLTGGRYSVDELFQALMLVSGNDAATALAEANGGVAITVTQMNAMAASLGAYDTYAQTPSGLDGWQQLTSAYDMALVLRQVVKQPRLIGYARLPEVAWPPKSSSAGRVGRYAFANQNTDYLTTVPGALLAKSGYTDAALHTYVAAARRNGHTLGVVLLRNTQLPVDQYLQAAQLLDWGFALKPGLAPVGRLGGSAVTNPPQPRSSLGSALAMATGGTRLSTDGWTILIPITAAVAGALWLGCVALGGRRTLQHQAPRRR